MKTSLNALQISFTKILYVYGDVLNFNSDQIKFALFVLFMATFRYPVIVIFSIEEKT